MIENRINHRKWGGSQFSTSTSREDHSSISCNKTYALKVYIKDTNQVYDSSQHWLLHSQTLSDKRNHFQQLLPWDTFYSSLTILTVMFMTRQLFYSYYILSCNQIKSFTNSFRILHSQSMKHCLERNLPLTSTGHRR